MDKFHSTAHSNSPAPTGWSSHTQGLAAMLDPAMSSAMTPTQVQRVLRNTYALLAMTLLFSALVASAAVALKLPAPGLILSLIGSFGLLFLVHKVQNSPAAITAVFAFTGFMGYSIAPQISRVLAGSGGGEAVALALGATGAAFLGLSALALRSKRDFSFMGGFLFVGMIIALVAGLAAAFLNIPGLALAVSAMVALISAALILVETSRIVHGGERNYVMATVGLYLSVYNLFSSLLAIFGIGGNDD